MALVLALLLDAMLGEPRWLWDRVPHPAVLMGRAIGFLDRQFNGQSAQRFAGALVLAGLVAGAGLLGFALSMLPWIFAEIILGAVLLAQKSLVQHVQAVASALRLSIGDGRRAVAMIVGRDTQTMDAPAIARGAIESAAENLSDGVIAPAFWFAVAGLPGLLIYKITNTADSMIGYRTPRHEKFGWAAARFDDLLNPIPARLTALLIWLAARPETPVDPRGAWAAIRRDARLHRSPNAGWPEAAMASALGVSLSGPRSYDGQTQDFPWVHPEGRKDANATDVDAAVRMLWRSWAILLVVALLFALLSVPLLALW